MFPQILLIEPVQLELAVRYYPKSIEHVVQDVTISLFYLHAQQMVLKGALNVEDDVLVTLASLQAQVRIFYQILLQKLKNLGQIWPFFAKSSRFFSQQLP